MIKLKEKKKLSDLKKNKENKKGNIMRYNP
jgi:hypothetical protein